MSPHARFRLISIGSIVFALACSKGENPSGAPPAAVAPPVPAAEPAATAASSARYDAKVMFKARCVVCHGEKGHGDGPGAAALNPKPRDYTDPAWQGSVTDEQIKAVIVNGGAAVGKSPIMPASPDLMAKPEVVEELMKIVRGFKPS